MTPTDLLNARDAAIHRFAQIVAPTPTRLGELKSAAWSTLRRFNATGLASDADVASLAARAVEDAQEEYRAAFHPDALGLFVCADAERGQACEIYAVLPSGPECVFEAHAERVA